MLVLKVFIFSMCDDHLIILNRYCVFGQIQNIHFMQIVEKNKLVFNTCHSISHSINKFFWKRLVSNFLYYLNRTIIKQRYWNFKIHKLKWDFFIFLSWYTCIIFRPDIIILFGDILLIVIMWPNWPGNGNPQTTTYLIVPKYDKNKISIFKNLSGIWPQNIIFYMI